MRYYTNRHTTINAPYNALAVYDNTSPYHTVHNITPTIHYTAPLQDFNPHYQYSTPLYPTIPMRHFASQYQTLALHYLAFLNFTLPLQNFDIPLPHIALPSPIHTSPILINTLPRLYQTLPYQYRTTLNKSIHRQNFTKLYHASTVYHITTLYRHNIPHYDTSRHLYATLPYPHRTRHNRTFTEHYLTTPLQNITWPCRHLSTPPTTFTVKPTLDSSLHHHNNSLRHLSLPYLHNTIITSP